MKRIYLTAILALCVAGLGAQTRTTKKKANTTQKAKSTTNTKPSAASQLSVKDRIAQRLRDSATTVNTAVTTTTVINGIEVPSTNTNTTTTVKTNTPAKTTKSSGSSVNLHTTSSSTTTGGNSVTNTNAPVLGRPIPGTIPVTPTNAADVGGKPITQEQTRNTSTDVNRTQMNAINGNQVASAAQNPDNTTKNITNIVGESQWGTNQVGENQWTPPNNIITGFTRDFPAIRGATWTRDNAMNTYSARYRVDNLWASTIYNSNGVLVETRTELPLIGTQPDALTTFKNRLGALTDFGRISKIERPGREMLYEVRLSTGRIAWINNRGEEVLLQ